MSDQNKDTFYVGLCMAGAVSAGAYTAGVMDFLIEALEEWEKRKITEPKTTPLHQVVIPVMGGASAGGMTSIIAANALEREMDPVRTLADVENGKKRNKLFNSWVNLTQDDMFPELLKTNDLKDHKVESLFNADFISTIAEKTLLPDESLKKLERPYIHKNLRVFTTLTNLNGIKYHQDFNSNIQESSYHISKHSDYAAFELNVESYQGKGWMPLNFENEEERRIAIDSAMATGAFPIGLKARKVIRPSKWVNDLEWHKNETKIEEIPGKEIYTLNVDGGTINNEPFEKVQEAMNQMDIKNKDNSDYTSVCSTVLMIDPFPSVKPNLSEKGDDLLSVVGGTLTSMMNHLRFEPKSVSIANNPDDASRFLIAPVRYVEDPKTKIEGSKAIACGFLGGFGGFINRDFRMHDYFLGRANCEQFLRYYFTIPVEKNNPIISKGYAHLDSNNPFIFHNSDNKNPDGSPNPRYEYPIIPIFKIKADKPYLPEYGNGNTWPTTEEKAVDRFQKPMKVRFGKIIMILANMKGFGRLLLWIGNQILLRKMASKKFLNLIKKDMKEWGLLK